MLRKPAARWWRFTICLLLSVTPIAGVLAQGSLTDAPDIAWASPTEVAIKSLGQISSTAQTEDVNNINYDCTPETYHFQGSVTGAVHSGCFVMTAFGSVDTQNGVVNMNMDGVDGAIPLHAMGSLAVLPIPGAAGIAAISGASPSGSYLHIYTYLPSQVDLQQDWLLQPYLQLPSTGSFLLSGPDSQAIIINAQTMAYSTNGSWLVVESPWHSFLRINMATFEILPFAPSFSTQAFDLAQHNSQVAISDDGRYVAVASDEFNSFKVYDLNTCTGAPDNNLAPLDCSWHDYRGFITNQVPGWYLTRHLRFLNDDLLNFHASTRDGSDNSYLLAPTANITNLTEYLALGDSYSSGEGAFYYIDGTDTSNDKCHQSSNSYPYLLVHDVFGDGHSVACSGALINDIKSTGAAYEGQVKDRIARNKRVDIDQILADFSPGYLAQWEFAKQYQPRVMTVGVGGNDIGFADIIKACVEPHVGNNTCYATYEDRKELTDLIDRTYSKWVGMYRQLQSLSPSTRLYTIGYPQIAALGGECAVNVHLNAAELQFAHDLIDYLNSVIQKAASDSGVSYVDISHALDGHRLCEATAASVAVNGLTAGNDNLHILGNESYHPNALGHKLIEQAILHATHNFSDPSAQAPAAIGTPPTASDDTALLSMPKSSRSLRAVLPDSHVTNGPTLRGGGLFVTINGLVDGLAPHTAYTIGLRNDGTVLGTVTSDSDANIESTVMVPAGTSVGTQILDVTGTSLTGQPIDITTTVYIAASPIDSDNDGVPDQQDSCPFTLNSGQDSDKDGVDDTCDGLIGLAPTSGSASSSSDSSNPSLMEPSTPMNSAETATASTPRRSAGSVLGKATTQPTGYTGSGGNNKIIRARDNLLTIHWLPWATDTVLVGLLLALLAELFGRLASRAS